MEMLKLNWEIILGNYIFQDVGINWIISCVIINVNYSWLHIEGSWMWSLNKESEIECWKCKWTGKKPGEINMETVIWKFVLQKRLKLEKSIS